MSETFHIQLERSRYAPGEVIRGLVTVLLGKRSRSLEAFLVYREQTQDYRGAVHSVASGHLHTGELVAGHRFEFRLQVPQDALPAFRSEHGALRWEIDVKSDERGFDTHATAPVDVVPPDAGGVVFPATAAFVRTGLFDDRPPPPPGWYADPSDPQSRWRWWDGAQWTQHTS